MYYYYDIIVTIFINYNTTLIKMLYPENYVRNDWNIYAGMEAAAYLSTEERSSSVTVIGSSSVPFERSLGSAVGKRIQQLFEDKGIRFINSSSLVEIKGSNKVEKVRLMVVNYYVSV